MYNKHTVTQNYLNNNKANHSKVFVENMKNQHVGDDKVLLCANLFTNAMNCFHGVATQYVQNKQPNPVQVVIYVDQALAEERGFAPFFEVATEIGLSVQSGVYCDNHVPHYVIELHTLASAYRLMSLVLDLTSLLNND